MRASDVDLEDGPFILSPFHMAMDYPEGAKVRATDSTLRQAKLT
jgi:hypothetical protein